MRSCSIIIPVYNAFDETLACIRSVLKYTSVSYRLLVFDDASSQGSLAEFLPDEVLADPHTQVQRNEKNLGFVETCNRGMRDTHPEDVVLLNSDTEVTPGWLEKLQCAAYSSRRVATATPLTNNGQICSVPTFLKANDLPAGYTLNEFAALIERASAREYPEVPTCVGFCVYIKREALDRVGYFDEETFGKGYGEENDFSCRARTGGYANVVDDATFVYHRGGMSFQDQSANLMAEHFKFLARKHPDYSRRLRRFITENPMEQIHRRIHGAMLRRWMEKAEYSILHVLHNAPLDSGTTGRSLPGGTEFHVGDLIRSIPRAAHWSLFAEKGLLWLTAHVAGIHEQRCPLSAADCDLDSLLDPTLFDIIHLHQPLRFDWKALTESLLRHGNYFVSLHDFQTCCPETQLLTPDDRFCSGHECTTACGYKHGEVDRLRATTSQVFSGARAVIHFSNSTKTQVEELLVGDFRWKLIEHAAALSPLEGGSICHVDDLTAPSADRPLRVAFLGVTLPQKGGQLIRQVVKSRTLPSGIPVEWHVIGMSDAKLPCGSHVVKYGQYARQELPTIMKEASPDLVAILSISPETYCYTLDEALMCGVPVVSTPLGAPADRVRRNRCGWVLDHLNVDALFETLQQVVDDWKEYRNTRQRIATLTFRKVDEAGEIYDRMYCDACGKTRRVNSAERYSKLNQLASSARRRVRYRRLLACHVLTAFELLLGSLGLRTLAVKMASRYLPRRVQTIIRSL